MGKMKELYLDQQQAASGSGDEDYLYEQYIAQMQMNEEYWQWKNAQRELSIFPADIEYYESTYTPTIEEQMELDELLKKQNGHT
jgi:hypothetical protein